MVSMTFFRIFEVLFITYGLLLVSGSEDYYDLLRIGRDASTREIRQAFKKLALSLHPDKNKDDPNATDKFIKLNKAYEVLKDEEMRKKYDLYGEDGLKNDFGQQWGGGGFKSWNYYYENFGIYDDDPEIITLSRSDFEQSVTGTDDVWFINFYSPACSHCHDLAPFWRAMAKELDGVIRIGAVNCEEEWMLCRTQNLQAYPTLIMYPQKVRYQGDRKTGPLVKYALQSLSVRVLELREANFKRFTEKSEVPWLIFICWNEGDCPGKWTRLKVAAMLEGLVNVGHLDCVPEKEICEDLQFPDSGPYYFEPGIVARNGGTWVESYEAKEISELCMEFLPGATELKEDEFTKIYRRLQTGGERPWLIEFFLNDEVEELHLRKLPALLPTIKVGKVICSASEATCQSFFIKKYPSFALFKSGGGYEIHHGRQTAHDIAGFARDSVSSNVEALSPKDFKSRVVNDGATWLVDFYAPWCPPCMQLLPELRKASRSVSASGVHFGTIDCTVHLSLCQQHKIQSYPTSIFYNDSVPHQFYGQLSAAALIEFVEDILSPPVILLTFRAFESRVANRHHSEVWAVDFFAPWCGPCQQLAPQWRTVAKSVAKVPNVYIAQVDCTAEASLCHNQGITSYPSIRLYPLNTAGTSHFHIFSGWQRDSVSLREWVLRYIPSKVRELEADVFTRTIQRTRKPWVVDFYAPWCGHCHVFAPEFEAVAQVFGDRVNFGKMDCQEHYQACQQQGVTGYPSVKYYFGTDAERKLYPYGESIQSQDSSTIIAIIEEKLKKHEAASPTNALPDHSDDLHDEL